MTGRADVPGPWDDDDDEPVLDPLGNGGLVVEVTDNPVVAVLYGTDGEVLLELYERDEVPFGYVSATAEPDE